MQKKIIALAVAGLVSGGAFAQSNVTVFGVVDTGIESVTTSGDAATANNINRMRVFSSGLVTPRLGFRGSEDLGSGMKANFLVETGLGTDAPAASTLGDRSLTVGLSGGFGAVNIGRQYTPMFSLVAGADTFNYAGAGSAANIIGANTTVRKNNSVRMDSPSMGGFTFAVMLDWNTEGTTNTTKKDDSGMGLNLRYANGPISAGYAYEKTTVVEATNQEQKRNAFAGSYNFGVVSVQGGYLKNKVTATAAGTTTDRAVTYLGVKGSVGAAGTWRFQWGKSDDKLAANADVKFLGLGYQHALSKRTSLYANYGNIDNVTVGTADTKTYQFGASHSF